MYEVLVARRIAEIVFLHDAATIKLVGENANIVGTHIWHQDTSTQQKAQDTDENLLPRQNANLRKNAQICRAHQSANRQLKALLWWLAADLKLVTDHFRHCGSGLP